MPSNAILEQKKAYVAELADKLKNSTAGVIVSYQGITVADDTKLRKELREAGVIYKVYTFPCGPVPLRQYPETGP